MLTTTHQGNNADLIKEASDFYIKDGDFVADVTYGRGVFWKKTNTSRFMLFPSDFITVPDRAFDFRALPYPDECLDHFVLDPPYMHSPGKTSAYQKMYRTTDSHGAGAAHGKVRTLYHNEIMEDYKAGMQEAWRTLVEGGMLWVKCKDEIESGWQRWSHHEVYLDAREIGFTGKDLFILVTGRNIPNRNQRQLHARKTHSYLWQFLKPTAAQTRSVSRMKIR